MNNNTNTQLTGSIYLPNTTLYITGESSSRTYTGLACTGINGSGGSMKTALIE